MISLHADSYIDYSYTGLDTRNEAERSCIIHNTSGATRTRATRANTLLGRGTVCLPTPLVFYFLADNISLYLNLSIMAFSRKRMSKPTPRLLSKSWKPHEFLHRGTRQNDGQDNPS